MQYIYNQKQKVMFQSLELFPWKQSFKNQVFKKKLVFSTDIMTYNGNIKKSKAILVNMVLFIFT